MKKITLILITLFILTGCTEKRLARVNNYIGVAEKVEIIHTDNIDSSGRPINLYDIYINGSIMRINTGCFKGQKVYRRTFNLYRKEWYKTGPGLIFCYGEAKFK